MNKNFYDMTNVTGKSISDAKRIQSQTAYFLKNYDKSLQESLQAEEDAKMNAAMSGARFGYATNVARSNNRINKLNEEIRYTNESSIIGMTEMVASVVEGALLLDENELVKIYPEYKDDIRSIVKGFLKNGELNSTITNPKTLELMEYVSAKLPSVREGVSLTEDELGNYIAMNKPLDIERSLKSLSGDVSSRVATLMEKEQKKAEQIEKDVKRAKAKQAKADETDEVLVQELINALEAGEITEGDLNKMLASGEISQNTYDEVINAYEDASEDADSISKDNEEKNPVVTSNDIPENLDSETVEPSIKGDNLVNAPIDQNTNVVPVVNTNVVGTMPKKQVQMLPDGTMNINIYENANIANEKFDFVRETPRCGLIESLAVNEATNLLNEGKAYDGDLCLAKAIMYVTITEAMDELDLMNVDEKKYSQIISAAGGNLNEGCKSNKKNVIKKLNNSQNKIPTPKSKKVDLNESILVSQYVPVRNNISNADSIAERIRKKRLNEQSNNTTLFD